ncbi:hypothetical protein CC78DRAFT_529239 [Lojkania enalia]|uniref:Uncharacterized protein n=1 Tax=Lojkania enalia TaxID=147567 RepID=A0A9P4NA61_9PLEO|nr:hypothetical protein CC78DRAFT_529239 [Didymosphaeria enalia]
MASNDDNSRRNRDHPEDNPFISFRRFADSQVSSLLNTVFTLPATLANFNNAHHAREQCLFGQANPETCKELGNIEHKIALVRAEGRELYRVGDLQAVLTKGEELMELDREADVLRKQIVEEGRRGFPENQDGRKQMERVEKGGSEKGQQWGWSWSWGFPKPFEDEDRETVVDEHHGRRRMCPRWHHRRSEDTAKQEEDGWQQFSAKWEDIKRKMNEELPQDSGREPKVWSWSFSWPPRSADAPSQGHPANKPPQSIFDELGDMIVDEVTGMILPYPFTFNNETYSPRTLEQDEELKRLGVHWRDAFEDLVRADQGVPLIPRDQLGKSRQMSYNQWARRFWDPNTFYHHPRQARGEYPKRVPWEAEETSEEPAYEYGHDHEDQHDDPPTPKPKQGVWTEDMPGTELDAYERLLGPASGSPDLTNEARPSILSTLTTTERTVATDGTVTTKVVLKKRFTDGREESSETVHTSRGQSVDEQAQDPWKAVQDAQFPSPKQQDQANKKNAEKKSGWFWSA